MSSLLAALAIAFASACTPNVGDKCTLSTDCSSRGDRLCDTSQPGGYCTIASCGANSCPDEAACVQFYAAVPGCFPDGRATSRVGRSFCMYVCEEDDDCRDGYVCRTPSDDPWRALIVDDDRSKKICVVGPRATPAPPKDSPVCSSGPVDAGFPPPPDAGEKDSGPDGAADAGADAGDGATDQ